MYCPPNIPTQGQHIPGVDSVKAVSESCHRLLPGEIELACMEPGRFSTTCRLADIDKP